MVRVKHGASAPALHLSTAAKRQLLEVDLAGSDPALMVGGKRARGDDGNLSEEEQEGDGHVGGRGGCFLCQLFGLGVSQSLCLFVVEGYLSFFSLRVCVCVRVCVERTVEPYAFCV